MFFVFIGFLPHGPRARARSSRPPLGAPLPINARLKSFLQQYFSAGERGRLLDHRNALHSCRIGDVAMGAAARMKSMRNRRRAQDLREIRLAVPDARSAAVRRRVAAQVASLSAEAEADAMRWIESVSEFDEPGKA
jgi:hypothetical protein